MAIEHELMMSQAMVTSPALKRLSVENEPPPEEPSDGGATSVQSEPVQNKLCDDTPAPSAAPEGANGTHDQAAEEPSKNGAQAKKFDPKTYLNFMPPKDFVNKQSVVYDEAEGIRCSPLVKDGQLLEYQYEDARTMHGVFLRGLRVSNNGACVGYRPGPDQPYKWITYQQVLDRAQHIGSGLVAKGAQASSSQFIGIFSQNRPEWTITEQACNGYSMVVVPLYDTLGPQAMRYIVQHCKLDYLIVDRNVKAQNLLKDEEIKLKLLVIMEEPEAGTKELAEQRGLELMTFQELEELGKDNKIDFVPPSPDDIHTICFTSGTTGNPKGAMLAHKTIVADISSISATGMESFTKCTSSDVHISYLPLAHMFEKVIQGMLFTSGARIGYFQGDIKLLMNDLQELKPTVFPMVPRLMNKIYDKIMAGVKQSKVKTALMNWALKSKKKDLANGIVSRNTIWDKLVFRKVQNLIGGRARLCVTGAAPISPTVLQFMRCALGVPFTEGYGQTEATAGITITVPGDYMGGNVGTIVPGCMVKLCDVPEKNYFAKDGKGEVCVKGPIVFQGYYADEEKTKQAIDEDGWLHTGDVGTFLKNGALKIFDRSKHIFKLAQGEYIAPEKIEQIYVQSMPVAQVFVHGDSLKASLVAVVVPDPDTVVGWCKERGVNGSYEEICQNGRAAELILEDMNAVGKKNKLFSFEMAKKLHLSSEMFSVENNLLTPTFKSRRPQLLERYKADIDKLYTGLE